MCVKKNRGIEVRSNFKFSEGTKILISLKKKKMRQILDVTTSLALLQESDILRSMSGRVLVHANGVFALDDSVESEILNLYRTHCEWVIV